MSVLRGLVVLRWATWAWAAAMTALSTERLDRPALAFALLGGALLVTAVATFRPVPVPIELAVGFLLLAGEGWAFEHGHAFAGRQGLAGGWPVVGVIAAGFTIGPVPAAVGGAAVGLGRVVGAVGNGVDSFSADDVASLVSTVGFYAVYGGVAGWVGRLLHQAERERAREEVARTLHDGVLQTLAVVERRLAGTEPEVAKLVRDTERDLRIHLEEPLPSDGPADLKAALRRATAGAARLHDLDVTVVAVDDVVLDGDRLRALEGAVAEAVTNVGKHAGCRRAVVFVERRDDGSTFVSVRDDGRGFEPAVVGADRHGLRLSITGRVEAAGGGAEIVSHPGDGTEVRLWVP